MHANGPPLKRATGSALHLCTLQTLPFSGWSKFSTTCGSEGRESKFSREVGALGSEGGRPLPDGRLQWCGTVQCTLLVA